MYRCKNLFIHTLFIFHDSQFDKWSYKGFANSSTLFLLTPWPQKIFFKLIESVKTTSINNESTEVLIKK